MKSSTLRRTLTSAAAAAATAALLLAGAGGASAHVGVTPDKTSANSYALLTFGIPHGCEESGTTKVAITLPAGAQRRPAHREPQLDSGKGDRTAGRAEETCRRQLHHQTHQPDRLHRQGTPAPRTARRTGALLKLPDAAGTTLHFPTLQTCETGQTDWSEIAEDGQDPHSLKAPAPSITITEAAEADGHSAAADTAGHSTEQASAVTDSGADARSWAGLAAGVGGLALGGVALARSGAKRKQEAGTPLR